MIRICRSILCSRPALVSVFVLAFCLIPLAQKKDKRAPQKRPDIPIQPIPANPRPALPDPLLRTAPQPPLAGFQSPVTEVKLDNGLKVLLQEIHSRPLLAVGRWYRVGSADDPAGLSGIAWMVERSGLSNYVSLPKYDVGRVLIESGGDWTSYTFLDQTAYLATVASNALEPVLKLEAERMSGLSTGLQENAAGRRRALAESMALHGDPRWILNSEVTALAFQRHPYRWPVSGWREDAMSHEALLQHHRRFGGPNNAVLVVTGDFETRTTLDLIQRVFGRIPRTPDPGRIQKLEPEARGERRIRIVSDSAIGHLQLAWTAPDLLNDDFYSLLILDAILSGAKGLNLRDAAWNAAARRSSRLYRALVDKKLATEVRSRLLPTRAGYLYSITARLSEPFQHQAAEEAVLEQLERLKDETLPDSELAQARNQLVAREFLDQETVSKRAHQLGFFESIASYRLLEQFEAKSAQPSIEDLRRVASRYFRDKARVTGWLVPDATRPVMTVETLAPSGDAQSSNRGTRVADAAGKELPLPDRSAPLQTVFTASNPSRIPVGGQPIAASGEPLGKLSSMDASGLVTVKPLRRRLANGVTVLVAEAGATSTVTILGAMKAGAAHEMQEGAGTAALVTRMLERGTTSKSGEQLAGTFGSLGAELSVQTGHFASYVVVRGLSKDGPLLIQLLAEMFQSASFLPAEFDKTRAELLGQLQDGAETSGWVAEEALRQRLYPLGHPLGRMAGGTLADVKSISLAQVKQFYQRNYGPDRFVLCVAGQMAAEPVFEAASKFFGGWSVQGGAEAVDVASWRPVVEAGEQRIELKGSRHSEIALAVSGVSISHPDFYPLLILNHLFGRAANGGRLAEHVREAALPAFAVETQLEASLAESPWFVRASCDPAETNRMIALIREEAGRMKDQVLSDSEVTSAKKSLVNAWIVDLESNEGIARQMMQTEMYQLGEDYLQRFPMLIQGVSLESLMDCARTRFDFAKAAVVVVGPPLDVEGRQ